ncbi:hypothetical protein [Geodermatophilus sp. SYSU D00696]
MTTTSTTSAAAGADGTAGSPTGSRPQERLEHVEALRRAATHLATAEFLERRADRSVNAALGALLRERARERRCRAGGILAGLGMRPAARRCLDGAPAPA